MSTIFTDTSYKGYYVIPKGSSLNVRKLPSTRSDVLSVTNAGDVAGVVFKKTITGQEPDKDGIPWYVITLKQPIKGVIIGCVRSDVISVSQQPPANAITVENARSIVAELVLIDQQIYQRLLVSFEVINRAKARGINTTDQEELFIQLAARYKERQIKLHAYQGLILDEFKSNMFDFLKEKFTKAPFTGLGGFPLIPVAVGVVIGTAITVGLYFALKPSYDEATVDFKQSEEFKKWIETVPAADKKVIVDQIEKQIDKAYNTGLTTGTFGGVWKVIKWSGVAIIGFIAVNQLMNLSHKAERFRKQPQIQP